MSQPWPMVPLGEVVNYRKEFIQINDFELYKRCRVQLHAKGIVLRDTVLGAEIKTKKQQLCSSGDLLVAEIDAKVGGFGIVPDELEGAIVSSHYFLFQINEALLSKRFLNYYINTSSFRDQVTAQGSTNYAAIRPNDVLGYKIPLPPLSEQKRLVARIEELAAKVGEARGLRRETVEKADILWQNGALRISEKLIEHYPLRPLRDLVTLRGGGTPSKSNPFFWDGSIPWFSPKDMKSQELHKAVDHISEDAIKNSAAKLIEPGAVLVVVRGMILAHTFPSAILRTTATINQDMKALIPCAALLPEFLNCIFWANNSRILEFVEKSTHDTRRLDISKLLDIKIGLPGIPDQRRIVAYLDGLQAKVDELKRLQAETSAELDAMLPSILDMAFRGGWRTRESSSHISSVQTNQGLGTTLEKDSGKESFAEFPAIYPATDTDRAVCAAALAIVEQSGTLSSREYLDALFLVTHPDMCKKLLGQKEPRSLAAAMKSAPKEIFAGKGQPIRWKECRDYLEGLDAITIARGTRDQFIRPGTAFASIKAGLPAGTDGVVKYALAAIERVRELRKNLASAPQDKRKALQALDKCYEENKIPA